MIRDDSGASDLRDTELLNIANLAGSYYKAKKVRDLLLTEIRKCNEEMVHLRDRGAVVGKQLRETLEAIEEIELRVAESQRRLVEAQAEMVAAEEENAKIESYERDLEGKREMLSSLRQRVTLLNKEVQEESLRLKTVESSYARACSRKEETEQEVGGLDARLSKLEQEITVMQNTRDMIKGQMPEHLDPEVFQDLQGNSSMNLEEYFSEVRLRVSTVENEISSFKMQLDDGAGEHGTLQALEKELVAALDELGDYAAIDEGRDSILMEVSTIGDELARFGLEKDAGKLESQKLESKIDALEEAFTREKQHERELLDRLKHLEGRILELEGVDNVAGVLDKLRTAASGLEINLEVNSKHFDAMIKVKEDAEAMNASLKATVVSNREVVDRFERAISKVEDDTLR